MSFLIDMQKDRLIELSISDDALDSDVVEAFSESLEYFHRYGASVFCAAMLWGRELEVVVRAEGLLTVVHVYDGGVEVQSFVLSDADFDDGYLLLAYKIFYTIKEGLLL